MIVRKIREEEIRRAQEVFHLSFEFRMEDERSNEEMRRDLRETPCGRFDRFYGERWAAFEDDDKTMMSVITATPFPVYFDGQVVPMRGIGGVSTLPPYRRRGAVRACLAAALRQMREEGTLFSYLYPFSAAYYAQFGYGRACERLTAWIPIADRLPFPETGGGASLVEKGRHIGAYRAVYDAFAARYNLMVAREEIDYEPLRCARPERDGRYTYVWHSAAGVPKGAMTFRRENRVLRCEEFFFTDAEGFRGLLNLAHAFRSYADLLEAGLPPDRPVVSLVPDWDAAGARRELEFRGMVRVIDVQKVLRLARYRGDGRAVVAVRDELLPENTGAYRVVYRDGRAAEVCPTGEAPDVALEIAAFSRLIAGTASLEELCFAGLVPERAAASEALRGIFYPKPNFIANSF
ncbi:MAG TPA: GNAT family N-acetyltransferase [Firmicutes bacterium]|nr:GNAT family N-acetyltransferase [Bacillota bacterium]